MNRPRPEPGPWFWHIWRLYQLAQGGYPFGADDLTIDEWLALGELKTVIEQQQQQRIF